MTRNNLPNNWQVKTLGEIAEVIAGQSPPSSTYNNIQDGLPFFQGKVDFGMMFPKVRVWCNKPIKIAKPNDILISVRAPVGPTNISNIESCIGRGLSAIRAKENSFYKYIFYFLRAIENRLSDSGRGSTFSAITQFEIRNILIPFPPLPIQKQIAEILEKADEAKQKRKEANKLTDEFLQSVFIEMFGDPVKNPKGWEVRKINDVIIKIENENPMKFADKDYTYIDISSIDNILKSIKETRNIRGFNAPSRARQLVFKNDILVSTVRPNLNTVTIIKKNFKNSIASTGFCVLRVKDEFIVSDYLFFITIQSFFVNHLTKIAKGASYPAVTDSQIKDIKIAIPPLSLQHKFAEIVNKTEALKEKQKQSEQELENLFQSLMQKAFKGELVA